MKKTALSLIAIAFAVNFSYAQWTGGPTGPIYYNGGNAGIGTSSPTNISGFTGLTLNNGTTGSLIDLQLANTTIGRLAAISSALYIQNVTNGAIIFSANGADRAKLDANGNFGIGTITPASQLDIFHSGTGTALRVGGNSTGTSNDASIDLYTNNSNNVPAYARIALGVNTGSVGSESGYLGFSTINSGSLTEKVRVTKEGNVGIGTLNPDQKLSVKGTIHSQEVIVDMSVLPDYVFKPAYHLPTLTEIKAYIDQNHHLPEMPSAEQAAKDGLSLGDMNAKLLKKVEELTLYLIQKDRQVNDQQATILALQKEMAELKKQVSTLIKSKP